MLVSVWFQSLITHGLGHTKSGCPVSPASQSRSCKDSIFAQDGHSSRSRNLSQDLDTGPLVQQPHQPGNQARLACVTAHSLPPLQLSAHAHPRVRLRHCRKTIRCASLPAFTIYHAWPASDPILPIIAHISLLSPASVVMPGVRTFCHFPFTYHNTDPKTRRNSDQILKTRSIQRHRY